MTILKLRHAVLPFGLAFLMACLGTALSQPAPHSERAAAPATESQSSRPERPPSASSRRLPADITTEHTLDLPGRNLRFKATAGSLPINNPEGALQAEIAYTAYSVAAPNSAARPVTFAFNGGPGASSAYLHLGAMGPWRLPLDNIDPATPPVLLPNAETWLDFTDLVFVDPVGTGYSHLVATNDAARRHFFSVDGDADSLAVFIRKWIDKYDRRASAKFIVGESYGGFRAPKIAVALQRDQGMGVNGLVLVSPVLDFGWRAPKRHSPLLWVSRLPSMAATAREAKLPFDREALREVERYAAGEFLQDLLRGERDAAAIERISARVAAFTGLDPALVRRLAGRIDLPTFQRELNRDRGLIASAYDATITGLDPYPNSNNLRFPDPFMRALRAPLTGAATALYRDRLGWRVDAPYQLLDSGLNGRWDWGRGRSGPDVVDDLRTLLSDNRRLRVLVTHGASDLVTPYFENQLIIDQLPAFGSADRLKLSVYGGGHMFYSRDASRRAVRAEAEQMFRAARELAE